MPVNIKVKLDIKTEIDKTVKGILKGLGDAQKQIENASFKLENGFNNATVSAEKLLATIEKSASGKGIDKVVFAIKTLEKGFREGTISQQQYTDGIEKLKK